MAVAETKELSPVPKKIGRPSSYRPEYCEQIIDYFRARQLSMRTMVAEGSSADQARAVCSSVPTFQGFAESIGATMSMLQRWEEAHEDFRLSRARAKQMQEQWFADALATGVANPTGAIFVAKNMLGWRDKIDIDQTVNAGQDAENGARLRDALNAATPDQLQQFSTLIEAILANRPAITESTT